MHAILYLLANSVKLSLLLLHFKKNSLLLVLKVLQVKLLLY
jgi:hypothetical protein